MATHRTVDLALLGVAVVWGSTYLAAKDVVTADTVVAFLAIRFGIAAAGLALIVAPRLGHLTRAELGLGAVFGVILSGVLALETFGVSMTSASNAGLIIALTIVMTPLLEQWVRHTHLPPTFYGATVIVVAGVGLLTRNGGAAGSRLGDLLMLLAAAARAVHVTVIAHLSAGRRLDSARVTLVQLATCLVVFGSLSLLTGGGVADAVTHLPLRGWLITVYLALGCTVFAFVIQMWAVRRTSSSRVSLLLGTEPLWAAAFGVLIAGDPVTAVGAVGAGLILLGTNCGRVIDSRRSQPRSADALEDVGLGLPDPRDDLRGRPLEPVEPDQR